MASIWVKVVSHDSSIRLFSLPPSLLTHLQLSIFPYVCMNVSDGEKFEFVQFLVGNMIRSRKCSYITHKKPRLGWGTYPTSPPAFPLHEGCPREANNVNLIPN